MAETAIAPVERYCPHCEKTTSWVDDGTNTLRLVCEECGATLETPLTDAQFAQAMKRYAPHRRMTWSFT